MLNLLKKAVFSLLVSLSPLGLAFASSITVYPLITDLTYQNRYQDIQVNNTGTDTAYVELSIFRVNNPGTPKQSIDTLNDNPYQIGLIATPNKMVIPPGQMRISRVLFIGPPPKTDDIYEVKFTPMSGQLIAVGNANTKDSIAAGLQLVIAYGVSVFVRPAELDPVIQATRNGTNLTLSNTGNTSVLVGDCRQCSGSDCEKAIPLTVLLYPGNSKTFTLPQAAPLQCQKEVLQNDFSSFNIP